MGGPSLRFKDLTPGYQFPPSIIKVDDATVDEYLLAVTGGSEEIQTSLFVDSIKIVPPTAAGVIAMRKLMEAISLPNGSVQVSQEFEFKGLIAADDVLTCVAEVAGKQERGGIRLLTLVVHIHNEVGYELLKGRIIVSVPPADAV